MTKSASLSIVACSSFCASFGSRHDKTRQQQLYNVALRSLRLECFHGRCCCCFWLPSANLTLSCVLDWSISSSCLHSPKNCLLQPLPYFQLKRPLQGLRQKNSLTHNWDPKFKRPQSHFTFMAQKKKLRVRNIKPKSVRWDFLAIVYARWLWKKELLCVNNRLTLNGWYEGCAL